MRAALLVLLAFSGLASAEVGPPKIESPVTDLVHALREADLQDLIQQLRRHHERSGVQLAVLIVATTEGESIESFSLRTAQAWGGGDKRRNDGGLFVLALEDRRMRLELGYGLEGCVTDGEAARILTAAKRDLRSGQVYEAIQGVVDQLMRLTRDGTMTLEQRRRLEALEKEKVEAARRAQTLRESAFGIVMFVFFVIALVVLTKLVAEVAEARNLLAMRSAIVVAVLMLAVELALGATGLGWYHFLDALCGLVAGGIAFALGVLFIYGETGSSISFSSSGASSSSRDDDGRSSSDWSARSSSSSDSSSWSDSSSSSSSDYSGGGGSFGGGGASSDW